MAEFSSSAYLTDTHLSRLKRIPSGSALIIPWDIVATSWASEERVPAASTVYWPETPRHTAHTTAHTLEAPNARPKPHHAAVGSSQVWRSACTDASNSWHAVARVQWRGESRAP